MQVPDRPNLTTSFVRKMLFAIVRVSRVREWGSSWIRASWASGSALGGVEFVAWYARSAILRVAQSDKGVGGRSAGRVRVGGDGGHRDPT